MIRASSLRLAAVLASAALLSGPALAQQSTQQTRGGTSAKKPQQTQSGQRNGAKGAQQKPGNAAQAKPGGAPGGSSQPTLVASFQDWGAHVSGQGRSKVCYAVSEPKDRLPKDLKRDP